MTDRQRLLLEGHPYIKVAKKERPVSAYQVAEVTDLKGPDKDN